MSTYAYVNAGDPLCLVNWGPGGNAITLRRGDVWDADDEFVQARPDLFSSTPVVLHSSSGEAQQEPTPLAAPRRRGGKRG